MTIRRNRETMLPGLSRISELAKTLGQRGESCLRNPLREIRTAGSVGVAPGNRRFYPERAKGGAEKCTETCAGCPGSWAWLFISLLHRPAGTLRNKRTISPAYALIMSKRNNYNNNCRHRSYCYLLILYRKSGMGARKKAIF